jgi:hypothetical protein
MKKLNEDKLQIFFANQQCTFVKNAPHASHAGGVWERQICTIREALRTATQRARLDDWSLQTMLHEAMFIVNNHPLAVTNLNDPKGPLPLTPNNILTRKGSTPLPPSGNFVIQDLYLRKRWRRVQFMTE